MTSEKADLRKEDKVIGGDEIGENRFKARPKRTLRLSTVSTEDNWKITKGGEKRCMQLV